MLDDDEWTSGVGPIRGGSTSLPRKTALYTTTRGKLTQDECNEAARAREFTPSVTAAGARYLDDSWVKHNHASPEADALYRAAQENSRTLKGKGAGLTRADIDAIRVADGQEPFGA